MESLSLPKLGPHRNLTETVYDALKTAIVECTLPAGSRVTETAVASNFGVSTTPVREALTRLEREGLVTLLPRRGAVIVSFSAEDILKIGELREVLELHAVTRALERPNIEATQRLAVMLAEGDHLVEQGELRPLYQLDSEFHRQLVMASGNQHLLRVFDMLNDQFQMIRWQGTSLCASLPMVHAMHRQILAAFTRRDADETRRLLRMHIRRAVDALAQALAEPQDTTAAVELGVGEDGRAVRPSAAAVEGG